MTEEPVPAELAKPDIVRRLFVPERLGRLIARMESHRDSDSLVVHPLQAPVLMAYGDELAAILSELVPGARWTPDPAYLCLMLKRSGGYRELVFPGLIDSIVGRCLIDALEPAITDDDGHRTFCGRSHANANKLAGDYERWFAMWQDYSARIAAEAEGAGFTYVFDTDVSDFFPSINRSDAREALAHRTRAHASLLSLLFVCLEAWLPRFDHNRMNGIPIEDNDVSRLVAHNYLKSVDAKFTEDECVYLRYVDDTVIFARSEQHARDLKQRHHLALRAIGLNPNAAKSEILDIAAFEERRHRSFNERLESVSETNDQETFQDLVAEWRDKATTMGIDSWEPMMRRLYSIARRLRSPALRTLVAGDVERYPTLAEHALSYLARFDVSHEESERLLSVVKNSPLQADVDIHLAKFFGDAVFAAPVSLGVANMAILKITREGSDHGVGYAKGLWLLALHKHGKREHRETVLSWATLERLIDEQFRLHFMYVYFCTDGLPDHLDGPLRHLRTRDIELAMRCCEDARAGRLARRDEILSRTTRRVYGRQTIAARYLPLIRAIVHAPQWRNENLKWLRTRLNAAQPPECPIVRELLGRLADQLAA